jgi:quinol monooxygenase YgiN
MYGLIGKLKAIPGQRDTLTRILLDGAAGMPGCLSYVVAVTPPMATPFGSPRYGKVESCIRHH